MIEHKEITQLYPYPAWPEHHFRAMGSGIGLWLEADELNAREAFRQVESLFILNELALSRFNPGSELSRLNARPDQWVDVSPLLEGVLARALAMAEETGGLFDPTILPALEAAGYTRSFEQIGTAGGGVSVPLPYLSESGRWPEVRLDRGRVFLPWGVRLDLGGIAKGYTAQEAVDLLGQYGPCLVDAGGDVTAGEAPRNLPGWPVALAAPWSGPGHAPENLLTVWLREATIATSGVDWRRWDHGGRPAHHLIDPRSGQPAATDALTATVLDEDASRAEGWATAALVLGMEEGSAALAEQGLAGALVDTTRRVALTPAMQPHTALPI